LLLLSLIAADYFFSRYAFFSRFATRYAIFASPPFIFVAFFAVFTGLPIFRALLMMPPLAAIDAAVAFDADCFF